MANAAAGSGRCARRVLLADLCGAGEAGASTRTVGDRCCAGRTCHRVRRDALFDGPGFPAIRGTEIGRPDALMTFELRAGLSGARQDIDTGICLAAASAYAR